MPLITVVLPTFNEAEHIQGFLGEVLTELGGVDHEVVVVDDDSPDGTWRLVEAYAALHPQVRLVRRVHERGLATAVIEGLRQARGTYVAVMDSDGQHPPGVLPRMLDAALRQDADLVVGSRYAPGGNADAFPPSRRVISWGAKTLAVLGLPSVRRHRVRDPMSGLFMARRDRLPDPARLRPRGYKILLELLVKGDWERVVEVGYAFGSRRAGSSKLTMATNLEYVRHVTALALGDTENRRMAKFALVGATGVLVNLAPIWWADAVLGVTRPLVVLLVALAARELAILWNFTWNEWLTFRDLRRATGRRVVGRMARFHVASLASAVVYFIAFAILAASHVAPVAAAAVAILLGFAANWVGNRHWTYAKGREPGAGAELPTGPPKPLTRAEGPRRGRRTARWAVAFFVLALALYLPGLDHPAGMTFDESHYVTVARHHADGAFIDPVWGPRDLPYNFEHPPLGKYAIWLGIAVLGDGPVGWRAPGAVVGALGVAGAYVLGRRLFDAHLAGALASALLLVDGMYFLHARMAMLEVYTTAGVVWGFALALGGNGQRRASGLVYGAAVATKFSALFLLPLFLLVHWLAARPGRRPAGRFVRAAAWSLALPFLVVVAAYAPFFREWWLLGGPGYAFGRWVLVLAAAFVWDLGAPGEHTYASAPWTWIPMLHPVLYHAQTLPDFRLERIYSLGNPVLWWPGAVAAVAVLLVAVSRWVALRGGLLMAPTLWRNLWRIEVSWDATARAATAALMVLFAWAPTLLLRRIAFMYYMTLVVPFFAVLMGGVLALAWRRGGAWRPAVVAYLGVAGAAFAAYHPLVTGQAVSQSTLEYLMRSLPWTYRTPAAPPV